MKRTSLFIDEQLETELRALAYRQGRSMAGMVREALESYVRSETRKPAPALSFVAAGRSGRSDTAERHEELLWRTGREGERSPRPPATVPSAEGRGRGAKPPKDSRRRRDLARTRPAATAGKRS